MRRILIITVVFLICDYSSQAQNDYYPIKGSVISSDSLVPIPEAHVISLKSYYGTTTDSEGNFSILTQKSDSLRISSIGFTTKIIIVNYDSIIDWRFEVMMDRDTIMLQEIDIFPYLDYNTFKEIANKTPTKKPFIIKGVNDNIESVLYQKPKKIPDDKGILSPIQTIYNRFNRRERLRRKMIRNRKRYNELLLESGIDTLIIPEQLEY